MKISYQQKQQLKNLIETQLIELKAQLLLSTESSQTVMLDQTMVGRVSRIDAIQQQKIAQAGLERDKRHYQQLSKTLKRIEADDFGYCLQCDLEICFERLLIKPESAYCVSCQQALEH